MTKTAFVLGNGESRQGIKIADLKPHGKVWACNGVYRTEEPDVLVAVDPKMILEIAETEYPSPTKCGPIGIISMKRWSVPRTTYSISSPPWAGAQAPQHSNMPVIKDTPRSISWGLTIRDTPKTPRRDNLDSTTCSRAPATTSPWSRTPHSTATG
jgi:hypothetical protein